MIPNLVCLIGKYGAGKSLHLLELGLKAANESQKPLVCNFHLNQQAVKKYCLTHKLNWFARHGVILYVDAAEKGTFAMLRPNSIVLFDEVGVFINARNWKSLSSDFAKRLPRLRHFNIHLICAFQFVEQVDKNIREQCQYWILCEGTSLYDKKLKMPKLLSRFCYHYDAEKFEKVCFDIEIRTSMLRKFFHSLKVQWSFLFVADWICAYRSFALLIDWYYRWLRSTNKLKYARNNPYMQIKSSEQLLFACYASNGFGEVKKLPMIKNRVIYVTDSNVSIPDKSFDSSFAGLMSKK